MWARLNIVTQVRKEEPVSKVIVAGLIAVAVLVSSDLSLVSPLKAEAAQPAKYADPEKQLKAEMEMAAATLIELIVGDRESAEYKAGIKDIRDALAKLEPPNETPSQRLKRLRNHRDTHIWSINEYAAKESARLNLPQPQLTTVDTLREAINNPAVSLVSRIFSKLKGSISGEKYTSPRGLFSVVIPKASNSFGAPFTIQEDTRRGRPDYDLVAFYVKDFGEVFIASVRQIPPDVQEQMNKEEPTKTLSKLGYKVLYDWRQNFPSEPEVVKENFFDTHLGKGMLRLYMARKGSLLTRIHAGKSEQFDTLIGVIIVRQDKQYIYAIAEHDFKPTDETELSISLESFFNSVEIRLPAASFTQKEGASSQEEEGGSGNYSITDPHDEQ